MTFDSPTVGRVVRDVPRRRLVCFPYPGAGATAYAAWATRLPLDTELCAVQLPGRETRIFEQPLTELADVLDLVTAALRPYTDVPATWFGHSGGGILAYEVARRLEGEAELERLVVSGVAAPGVARRSRVHELADEELRAYLRRVGGTPPAVLESDDLIGLLLPSIRADFTWCNAYRGRTRHRLSCPILAFAAVDDDEVELGDVELWQECTSSSFELERFDGGHFFIRQDCVVDALCARLYETRS
jgi:medium-chain acyl-[acyl-carrier-protein] hydrolase